MKALLYSALLVLVVALVAECRVDTSCRKKCGGRNPRISNCMRADHLWRWDGYSCEKMKVACYDVKKNDNAFESVQDCLKLCGQFTG